MPYQKRMDVERSVMKWKCSVQAWRMESSLPQNGHAMERNAHPFAPSIETKGGGYGTDGYGSVDSRCLSAEGLSRAK